jgi:hypothetical protein
VVTEDEVDRVVAVQVGMAVALAGSLSLTGIHPCTKQRMLSM